MNSSHDFKCISFPFLSFQNSIGQKKEKTVIKTRSVIIDDLQIYGDKGTLGSENSPLIVLVNIFLLGKHFAKHLNLKLLHFGRKPSNDRTN